MAAQSIKASFAGITARFLALSTGPDALTLDGRDLDDLLPQRTIPLNELQTLLLARSTPGTTRDRVWAELTARSRERGDEWATAALGLAMPALRNLARQFSRDFPMLDVEDLCSEILTGFLTALAAVDITRPGIMTRLGWATYRAARKSSYTETSAARARAVAVIKPTTGHPDLVLTELVEGGVISRTESDLISAIRLDGRKLADVAELLEISPNAVLLRLRKSEMRVAAHLTATTEASRMRFKKARRDFRAGTSESIGRG